MSKYFKNLNYTMANEDTEFEYQLLRPNLPHVLSVCGSGSRVLPLFAKSPQKMSLVDFSLEQIALTKLRIELVRSLTHEEFLLFMGYKKSDEYLCANRKTHFSKLSLDSQAKNYLKEFFDMTKWNAPLYSGHYEVAIKKISSIIQLVMGKHIAKIKSFKNKEDFDLYYKSEFPHIRWRFLLLFLGNSTFFNALLYKGNHPKKNIKETYPQYYREMFSRLFKNSSPNESFFLQFVFFGEVIFTEGFPFEAKPEIFQKMKDGIKTCKIEFHQGDLIKIIEKDLSDKIDFISFSDILSYFDDQTGSKYLQKIKDKLNINAMTVHRYYFHINKYLNYNGYKKITKNFLNQIHDEKTQIYIIDVYKRKEN